MTNPGAHVRTLLLAAGLAGGQAYADLLPPATGLQAWYKADAGVTIDGNGNLDIWQDQSGSGNHTLVNAAPGWRPTVTTAAMPIGGTAPVISFNTFAADGQYDIIYLPSIQQDGGTGATVYIVINDDLDTPVNPWEKMNKNWLNRSAAANPAVYGNPNGQGYDAGFYSGDGDSWHAEAASGVNGWKVARFSWVPGAGGNFATFITNFALSSSGSETFGPAVTGDWVSIGFPQYNQETLSSFAEILIYDRALTPAEDAQALAYLESRYFNVIPEPASLGLLALGGLALLKRRRTF